MSFYSSEKRAGFDFARGRSLVAWAFAQRAAWPSAGRIDPMRAPLMVESGHVEHDGVVYPDPHFQSDAKPMTEKRASPLDRLMVSVAKLTPAQRNELYVALGEMVFSQAA